MGARYRLWSFVTDGFVIKAPRVTSASVCMGMYVLRAGTKMGFIVFSSQLVLIGTMHTELYTGGLTRAVMFDL